MAKSYSNDPVETYTNAGEHAQTQHLQAYDFSPPVQQKGTAAAPIPELINQPIRMLSRATNFLKTAASGDRLAKGLGMFGIALGIAQVLAPRFMARAAGLPAPNTTVTRLLYGMREITSGLAIFSQGKKPAESLWLRVAGDLIDISTLTLGLFDRRSNRGRILFSLGSVLAITALDVAEAQRLSKSKGLITEDGATAVKWSIFVNKSPEYLYTYWKVFENLPTFMRHLVSVRTIVPGRTQWVARAPMGKVKWEAEVTADKSNEQIAWQSLPGSLVSHKGRVSFDEATGGKGAFVTVELEYKAPGGMLGSGIARLFHEEPLQQLKDDLKRFKQVVETGEVVCSDGSPTGNGQIKQHAAQPQLEARKPANIQPSIRS